MSQIIPPGSAPAPYDGPSRRALCKTGDMKHSGGGPAPPKAGGIKAGPPAVSAAPRAAPAAAPRVAAGPKGSPGDRDQMDKLNHQLEVRGGLVFWGGGLLERRLD